MADNNSTELQPGTAPELTYKDENVYRAIANSDWFTSEYIISTRNNTPRPEREGLFGPYKDRELNDFLSLYRNSDQFKAYTSLIEFLDKRMVGSARHPLLLNKIEFADEDYLNFAKNLGVDPSSYEVERSMVGAIDHLVLCLIAPENIRSKVVKIGCNWADGFDDLKTNTLLWAELVKRGARKYLETIETATSPELARGIPEALVILGIGGNLQVRGTDRQPVISEETMRRNAIAGAEIDRLLDPNAVIIPTGKGTELVAGHYQTLEERENLATRTAAAVYQASKGSHLQRVKFVAFPQSEVELTTTAEYTQGELMRDLIPKVRTKHNQHSEQTKEPQSRQIWPEKLARNTILNLIESLNMLDEKTSAVWQGKMLILTTNTGHMQRAEEIARALGLSDAQMLSSEEILLQSGYGKNIDPEIIKKLFDMTEGSVRENEKNLRATREITEFFIPELIFIKNDTRLKNTLTYLLTDYYQQYPEAVNRALRSYGIENYQNLTAAEIRNKIAQVGIDRTKLAYNLLSNDQREELGIANIDKPEDIRLVLAGGVKPAEMINNRIKQLHPNDLEFLTANGLTDIVDKEWYRIKNWLFGRILPPSDWGNQASLEDWNRQNIEYNEQTKVFLQQREKLSAK